MFVSNKEKNTSRNVNWQMTIEVMFFLDQETQIWQLSRDNLLYTINLGTW